MIKVDSMPSEEFSQELSLQDKKSELWDLTTFQEKITISILKTFKEQLS